MGIGAIILLLVLSNVFAQNSARTFEVKTSCWNEYKGKMCKHVESPVENPAIIGLPAESDDSRELTFEDSKLTLMPGNLFKTFKYLERLHIRDCGVRFVRISTFQNSTKLKFLDLAFNEIGTLPSEVFMFVPTLVLLSLSHNKVTSLEWDTFAGLSKLKRLYLDGNKITKLPAGLFKPLTSVEQIFLQNNQIEVIEKEIFEGNPSLEKIDLSNNQMKVIERGSLGQLKNLRWLDVADNSLAEIETGGLVELHANRAGIKTCDIIGRIVKLYASDNRLQNVSIYDASATKVIHLRNNSLTDISNLGKAVELHDLDISQNPIEVLAANALSNLTRLKYLNLSLTDIRGLHEDTFQSQKQLETLDLSGNFLEKSNFKTMKPMKNLRALYIADNQIQELDYHNVRDFLPSLKEIDISGNPLNCTDLVGIMDFLRAHYIHCRDIKNSELNCAKFDRISPEADGDQGDFSLEVMSSNVCSMNVNESINAAMDPLREDINEIKATIESILTIALANNEVLHDWAVLNRRSEFVGKD